MPFPRYPRQKTLKSLVDAAFIQFWLHDSQRPEPFAARHTTIIAELAILTSLGQDT